MNDDALFKDMMEKARVNSVHPNWEGVLTPRYGKRLLESGVFTINGVTRKFVIKKEHAKYWIITTEVCHG